MHKRILRFFLIVNLFVFDILLFSQEIPIGTWRDHLSYSNAVAVTEGNNIIYCASESAVFSYDRSDNSLERLNLISGLSDIVIKTIKFNKNNSKLLIAYQNGNLDIVRPDKQIINLSFIKNSNIIADKTINEIYIDGVYAYLSTGFGIVVIDTDNEEIIDTYYIGNLGAYINVNSFTIFNGKLYAATNEGVYYADKSSTNLADYNNWSVLSELGNQYYSNIINYSGRLFVGSESNQWESDTLYFNENGVWQKFISSGINLTKLGVSMGKLIVSTEGALRVFNQSFSEENVLTKFGGGENLIPSGAVLTGDEEFWVADKYFGLVHYTSPSTSEVVSPNGPNTSSVFSMDLIGNSLWTTAGGYSLYRDRFLYNNRVDGSWKKSKTSLKNPENQSTIYDLISVVIDPNDNNHVFMGSWSAGLLELYNNELQKVYNAQNSALDSAFFGITSVGSITFDNENNLWVTSSYSSNVLSVKTNTNEWYSYSFPGKTQTDGYYTKIIRDKNNIIWFLERKYNTILVFDSKSTYDNTSDDTLYTNLNFGNATIYTFEEDKNGEFWFGTSEGVGVLSNPAEVFTSPVVINPIYIQQDGQTQLLLESENVTTIAVDGANRKWFGTQNSGAYLMSEDGTEEIEHFTRENSPLFSNNIYDIKIDGKTGEVYFATEKGLISYKGTATEDNDDFSNVFVYPNPVKPDYYGVIAIRGLIHDTDVRITDISGNLVFQTKSLGGQAIWDGNDLNGQRVKTGVYVVFCATQDGGLKNAAKILFIN